MRFASLRVVLLCVTGLALFSAGCAQEISSDQLASKIGRPHDVNFFGDQAVYMGDRDGYRYVHLRDMFDFWGFLGECDYKVRESQWPMKNPMRLTGNASKWRDVTWLDGNAPEGVPQNVFLTISPSYPEGTPKTQPASMPSTTAYGEMPGSEPIAVPTPPAAATAPASAPTTQPAASQP